MQKEAELYSLRAQNIIGGNIYFFCDEIFIIKYFSNVFVLFIWIEIWLLASCWSMNGLQDKILCLIFPVNFFVRYLKYFTKY